MYCTVVEFWIIDDILLKFWQFNLFWFFYAIAKMPSIKNSKIYMDC